MSPVAPSSAVILKVHVKVVLLIKFLIKPYSAHHFLLSNTGAAELHKQTVEGKQWPLLVTCDSPVVSDLCSDLDLEV